MILTIYEGRSDVAKFTLIEGENFIGRKDAKSPLLPPQVDLGAYNRKNQVYERHACLTVNGTEAWLEDLGTHEGTYFVGLVKLEPGKKYPLIADDEFLVGGIHLVLFDDASQGW